MLLALGAGCALTLNAAQAGDALLIDGTYLRNQVCSGDTNDTDARLVKITAKEIYHAGGVCTIDDRREDGKTVTMRVSCKFKSGAILSSSISFTLRDDKTLDMEQLDGSFKAVLSRCPG